jgi:hypothetical protein
MSRGKKSFGSGNSLTPWLLLSAVVILLDQITKIAVERRFSFAERLSVIPGFFDGNLPDLPAREACLATTILLWPGNDFGRRHW